MISKELLSLVLDKNVIPSHELDNNIEYGYSITGIRHTNSINIYELAHKCKVKAYEYGYRMMSCQDQDGGYCEVMEAKHYPPMLHSEILDFEYKAVFKCFQWILDNKEAN